MKLTRKDVEHVAGLARLQLSDAETDLFTGQMDAILSYVDKLSGLNTDGIIPTSHAVPMENAFRADEPRQSIGTDRALANAPEQLAGYFKVPKVIE